MIFVRHLTYSLIKVVNYVYKKTEKKVFQLRRKDELQAEREITMNQAANNI